jgi:hypothetical protein
MSQHLKNSVIKWQVVWDHVAAAASEVRGRDPVVLFISPLVQYLTSIWQALDTISWKPSGYGFRTEYPPTLCLPGSWLRAECLWQGPGWHQMRMNKTKPRWFACCVLHPSCLSRVTNYNTLQHILAHKCQPSPQDSASCSRFGPGGPTTTP